MGRPRMHDEQVDADVDLVRALVREQRPDWADLPVRFLETSGTDNAIFRIGDELVARLPIIGWAAGQVDLEWEWLPRLAPHLPVEIPQPVFVGEPGLGYPFRWAVHRWIDGENAHHDRIDDPVSLARDLASFVRALRRLPTDDMPRSTRGRPIADPDGEIRRRILALADELDADALLAAWDDSLAAPHWAGPFVPVHGDLSGNNLLLREGRLVGVIGYSCFGVGEPANDLEVAWELFDDEARAVYREELGPDDATWSRGRGWAIRSVYGIPDYRQTNPGIVERAFRRLENVIADWRAAHP